MGYDYQGDATCAADGMCQVKCPVKINTGELIKQIRSDELEGGAHPRAEKAARVRASFLAVTCSQRGRPQLLLYLYLSKSSCYRSWCPLHACLMPLPAAS